MKGILSYAIKFKNYLDKLLAIYDPLGSWIPLKTLKFNIFPYPFFRSLDIQDYTFNALHQKSLCNSISVSIKVNMDCVFRWIEFWKF